MNRRPFIASVLAMLLAAPAWAQTKDPQKMRTGDEVLDASQYEVFYLGAVGVFIGLIFMMVLARKRYGPRGGSLLVNIFAMGLVVLLFTFGL